MSLLTNFQDVENKISLAKNWSNAIINHRLPYTPIQYIQSTGTQYINTGTALLSNTSWTIELDIQFTAVNYNYNGIWGITSGSTNYESWIASSADCYTRYHGTKPSKITVNTTRCVYKDYYSGSILYTYLNGTQKRAYSVSTSTTSYNLNILRCSSNNGKARLYRAKLYTGNSTNLVRDFVPVLDINGVACLYDNVSGTYFYNAGTGVFTAGPTV